MSDRPTCEQCGDAATNYILRLDQDEAECRRHELCRAHFLAVWREYGFTAITATSRD